MAKLSPKDVSRFIADVPKEKAFWVNKGPVLKNLKGLADALEKMPEDTFKYHANKQKNDFYNWVKDVIGDIALADSLKRAATKQAALDKVRSRLFIFKSVR